MDIGQAFGVLFEDEDWITKLLLGSVIMLIPIFGQMVIVGYGIAIIRNVIADNPQPLPAWNNIDEYFMDGLKFWVINLVYAIPLIIIICLFTVIAILPVLGGESEELVTLLTGITGVVSILFTCLVILYAILLAFLQPVLSIHYAERGEIGACLRFGDIFQFLFANLGPILVSQAVLWAVNVFVMPIVSTVSCGLLVLPATVWLKTVSSHLYGQISIQTQSAVPFYSG